MAKQKQRTNRIDRLVGNAALITRRAREYVEAVETYMPVIERTNIQLAEIQAGIDINTQLLVDALEAHKMLAEKARAALSEQGAAVFNLKEYEDVPAQMVDMSGDLGTLLINIGHNPGLLANALQQATPESRLATISELDDATRQAWRDALGDTGSDG